MKARWAAAVTVGGLALAVAVYAASRRSWSGAVREVGASTSPVSSPLRARASSPIAIAWLPRTVSRFAPLFEQAAAAHRVDPELLAVVALVESGGWVGAVSPSGAVGLMQVMPSTGAAIAEERRLSASALERLAEPATNVDFGAYYLGQMLTRFGTEDPAETVRLAASAYNGGPTTLARHLAGERELSEQTQRYRVWVGGMYAERREEQSATLAAWLAAGGQKLVDAAEEELRGG